MATATQQAKASMEPGFLEKLGDRFTHSLRGASM